MKLIFLNELIVIIASYLLGLKVSNNIVDIYKDFTLHLVVTTTMAFSLYILYKIINYNINKTYRV